MIEELQALIINEAAILAGQFEQLPNTPTQQKKPVNWLIDGTNSLSTTVITKKGIKSTSTTTSASNFSESGTCLVAEESTSPTTPTSAVSNEPSSPKVLLKNSNKETVTQQIDKIIFQILKTYLNENSVLEVNLPNTTRKSVLQNFRKRVYMDDVSKISGSKSELPYRGEDVKPEPIDTKVLDGLKQDVWLNLKDTFGRLQLTTEYQLFKEKKNLENQLNMV